MTWQDEVEPLYTGSAAKVWRFAEPDEDPSNPRMAAHIPESNHLIFAPQAHPNWSWHVLMGVNLRPAPGLPTPYLQYPQAEYELMVFALDPSHDPPDPRVWPGVGSLHLLQPQDVTVQFHGTNDEQATELFDLVARAVSTGYGGLIPDSDWRADWEKTIKKTAEHYRGHPEHN